MNIDTGKATKETEEVIPHGKTAKKACSMTFFSGYENRQESKQNFTTSFPPSGW